MLKFPPGVAVLAAALLSTAVPATAAIITNVPMQGGMVMPMVSYSAGDGMLHVMMPTNIPQLTPLLISNPTDTFDAALPWYGALDPFRQGLSFSRRYGFVMDAMTDPLPAGTAIWLRRLSGSPELQYYRYSGSAPIIWQPVFGSAGSSNALFWNQMMFHPTITAPTGTNALTATFEAYLVDTNTGAEVSGTASGPFVFNFTNVSDGRPTLAAGLRFAVAWPAGMTGYVLECASSLTATNWTTVTNTPVTLDGRPAVLMDMDGAGQFFRMRPSP